MNPTVRRQRGTSETLHLGYLGLCDAAPLIVAKEKGYYEAERLKVELHREVGWATIRDKVFSGELHAAQAPAAMLWACRLGIGGAAFPAASAHVLNLHGNALCLSNRLKVWGVHSPSTLRMEALRRRGERKLTFGVVYPFSSHNLQLRAWLRAAGLVPDRDVRMAVVPPAQMLGALASGTIDGFMAGEPWTSLAVASGEGWCSAWSGALRPGHIEKVLLVREAFLATDSHEHLVRALRRAGEWCDRADNRHELAALLASPRYLNLPLSVVSASLCGPFRHSQERSETIPDFHIFHRGISAPDAALAELLRRDLLSEGLLPAGAGAELAASLFPVCSESALSSL